MKQFKDAKKSYYPPFYRPYGAAVFFVANKDGTLRLVTNYRALNTFTVKNRFPLALIDDLFDKLAEDRIFIKNELTAGYNQAHIPAGDEPKTAFHTRYGLIEC